MIDVVGIGDDGPAGLAPAAVALVAGAAVLIGGRRHLELFAPVDGQERHAWPAPLRPGLAQMLERVGARTAPPGRLVALASGDPLLSGIGATLIGLLGRDQVRIHPAPSSEAIARARMGWTAEGAVVLSCTGRGVEQVRRHLTPGALLVVLCADGSTPARLAAVLTEEGHGASVMTAWWHLGGPAEGSRAAAAAAWDAHPTPDLVVVCVEVRGRTGRVAGPAPGRRDDAFEHDGQITKREVRAVAIAHLRPAPGAHLWDLGAGSGAVGIEWTLAAPRATVTAVERDPARADRIRRNAARLGVETEVRVVHADSADLVRGCPATAPGAPGVAAGDATELEVPDAVFVGGGLTAALVEHVWARLRPGGRFVAHAVTLGTEAVLVAAQDRYGGRLTRLSVEHAAPLGRHVSWTPQRSVVQWSATKEDAP